MNIGNELFKSSGDMLDLISSVSDIWSANSFASCDVELSAIML